MAKQAILKRIPSGDIGWFHLIRKSSHDMLNKIKRLSKRFKKIENTNETPFFTKDFFAHKKYVIGDYTYGKPIVLFEQIDTTLIIGKFCSIADGVTIFLGGNHRADWITTYPFQALRRHFPEASHIAGHPTSKGDVKIGNDVWIGRNATIMSGITIDDGAVIGAESVISKNIGPYEIWAGNPARFIKKRFDDVTIARLKELGWWNWEIEKIRSSVDILCSPETDKIWNLNTEDFLDYLP